MHYFKSGGVWTLIVRMPRGVLACAGFKWWEPLCQLPFGAWHHCRHVIAKR